MANNDNPYTDCMCLAARRFTRLITQTYDNALEGSGLKITQFSVLCALEAAEQTRAPLSFVADALDMDPSSLTRSLNTLERGGFIVVGHGEDKRQRFGVLTVAGSDALAIAKTGWLRAQNLIGDKLGDENFDALKIELESASKAFRTI